MIAAYIKSVINQIETAFKNDLKTVKAYGGTVSASETQRSSFSCPAVFIALQSFSSINTTSGDFGINANLVAFVLTKDNKGRDTRMLQAAELSGRLAELITSQRFEPDCAIEKAVLTGVTNNYGEAIDKKSMALFTVSWSQNLSTSRNDFAPRQLVDLQSLCVQAVVEDDKDHITETSFTTGQNP